MEAELRLHGFGGLNLAVALQMREGDPRLRIPFATIGQLPPISTDL